MTRLRTVLIAIVVLMCAFITASPANASGVRTWTGWTWNNGTRSDGFQGFSSPQIAPGRWTANETIANPGVEHLSICHILVKFYHPGNATPFHTNRYTLDGRYWSSNRQPVVFTEVKNVVIRTWVWSDDYWYGYTDRNYCKATVVVTR